MTDYPRHGARVFLVEDNEMLGHMVEELLESEGYRVDRFTNLAGASKALRLETFDLAVLDIQIQDELVFPLADELERQQTPFVFVSGAHADLVPARHAARPLLSKPYRLAALTACLTTLLSDRS